MFKLNAYKLKVYAESHKPTQNPKFYILSKGNNAGRPMVLPCPNCFVVSTTTETERDSLYWLCYAAWQTQGFRPFLRGSVIPFLTTGDTKFVINECLINLNASQLMKQVSSFKAVQKQQEILKLQLQKYDELKRVIALKMLKA